MNNQTPFDTVEKVRPQLSEADSSQLWDGIAKALPATTPVASPFQFSWFSSAHAVPLALVVVVVMGVGSLSTFAAAESAKPGDFLFPVERAIEELRISLASDTRAEVLRDEFARKRLVEIQALIDAELARLDAQGAASTSATTTATTSTAVSAAARIRIDTGINELFGLVNGLKTLETRNQIVTELKTTVNDLRIREDDDEYRLRVLNDGTRLEVRGDGDDERIEIRNGDERVRVRIKDGEVRTEINIDREDDDRDDRKENTRRQEDVQSRTLRILEEVEAEVFTDVTVVTVERRDGGDISFTTNARTKAEIVVAVATQTGVTAEEVEAVLEIDYENRAYRRTDTTRPTTTTPTREGDSTEATTAATIKKIDVDVERTVARVEVEYRDGKKERFNLTYTTKALLVTELALRLGLTESVVSNTLRLEIDND